MYKPVLVALLIIVFVLWVPAQRRPVIEELTQVSQAPSEIPKSVYGMAYDGEKLWFSVCHDKGHYATFKPRTGEWKYSDDERHHAAILRISQPFDCPGGIAFDRKTLWIGGSYGESLGSINTDTWQIDKHFTG